MRLTLPLPPTDNQIYWNSPYGGRILTSGAKRYAREVRKQIARLAAVSAAGWKFMPNVPYSIRLTMYFPAIENKGWRKSTPNRYKKIDTSNRQKLVIDSVMSAIGVDDCHIIRVLLEKRCDPTNPRLELVLREQVSRL